MSDISDFISIVSSLWPGFTAFAGLPDPDQPDVTLLDEILTAKDQIPAARSKLAAELAAWSPSPTASASSQPLAVSGAINHLLSLAARVAVAVHNAVERLPAAQDRDVYDGALLTLAARNAELIASLSAVGVDARSRTFSSSPTSARMNRTDAIAGDALTLATLYVVGAPVLVARCQKYLLAQFHLYGGSLSIAASRFADR